MKGVGEGGALAPGARLANAVDDALAPLDPFADLHATGAYRKTIAAVYAGRALMIALERARTP